MIFGGRCSNDGIVCKYEVDMSSVESGSAADSQVVFKKINNNAKKIPELWYALQHVRLPMGITIL